MCIMPRSTTFVSIAIHQSMSRQQLMVSCA